MTGLGNLIKRNCRLFFKDKGMFFTSLITPIILLVLYATFLANVYKSSFMSALPEGFVDAENIIDKTVAGQLFSSLLAVCCITVAFCSNMLMVQDKVNGVRKDLTVTPVKRSVLALSYYVSTAFSTLIVCFGAAAACFIYIANIGWYMSAEDVLMILGDIFLLVMFGTALSSIVNSFLTSQGQISAVGTVVSAGYGFICGAYMPISQFGEGLQKVLSFLPGTYGTSLLKNHAMRGVFEEMTDIGFPEEIVEAIKDSVDCNLYFFDNKVETGDMCLILAIADVVLIGVYIILNMLKSDARR
ncbi:MAG: ABC transporter permease [Oscillospiraceae bacterium]|nr:ABC transporter permease [Oscillospiraceae bacterium]